MVGVGVGITTAFVDDGVVVGVIVLVGVIVGVIVLVGVVVCVGVGGT